MKAAVLRGLHQPLSIEDVQIDKPGPDEVLVQTKAAGVCHSDLHHIDGTLPCRFPVILGHESAGVVEQVGANVSYVKPGDHVITSFSGFCGHCHHCLGGHMVRCSNGREMRRGKKDAPRLAAGDEPVTQFSNLSSFAEQILTNQNCVVKIREDMPMAQASLIGCGVTTGLGAVFHAAKVAPGSTVAVIGCGGVGLSTINGAAIAGAGRIIAVDVMDDKLEMAKTFGATDVINAKDVNPVEAVRELSKGGVEFSFECIGNKVTAAQAFSMCGIGGVATILGVMAPDVKLEIPALELVMEKKVQGSWMGSTRTRTDMPRFVDFYMQGKLRLDELISKRIPLTEINEAFDDMQKGHVARSVIVFD